MALTVSVSRGFTMVAEHMMTVDDWNAAFLPTITIVGGVGGADIANGAIGANHLGANALDFTAVTALALDDKLVFYDASTSVNATVTVANALDGIFGLAATAMTEFAAYAADKVTLHNGTGARTMTPAILAEQLIAQAPAVTSTEDADEVLVRDSSATDGSQAARVTLANILPNKGTAGTYAGVTGITTDDKGRVTAVTTASTVYARAAFKATGALPTLSGDSNAVTVTITPSLGGAADTVDFAVICSDAGGDAGYAQGEIVSIGTTHISGFDSEVFFIKWTTADSFKIIRKPGSPIISSGSTGGTVTWDPAKWQYRITLQRFA